VSTAAIRVAARGSLARVSERITGCLYLVTGAFLVYLVLFDQGAAVSVILGAGAGRENLLHEFFHDGRHLWNAPCH
jgi:Probable cobalt transporter subunit (CbtB)